MVYDSPFLRLIHYLSYPSGAPANEAPWFVPPCSGYGPFETINGGKSPMVRSRIVPRPSEAREMLKLFAIQRSGAIAAIVAVWLVSRSPLTPSPRTCDEARQPC